VESYEKRTWWSQHRLSERVAKSQFLEAAVTAAFLIAASDGSASEQEYDALLDRLEILGGVDRDAIDELLAGAAKTLEESGFDPSVARVADLLGDADDGEAALMLGLAVALADDDFSTDEREIAAQLAKALRLDIDLDAMLAKIRN
jgi:tellurite resistance protein